MKKGFLIFFLLIARPVYAVPNIIVIMTDDQRADTLAYMPNVQALAAAGVSFTNSFVTTSLCGPSRASFLTGQYAHNHGYLHNQMPGGAINKFNPNQTIATALGAVGYRTGYFGKYLNGYEALSPAIPPGWNTWNVFRTADYENFYLAENGVETLYENQYSTDFLKDRVVNFVSGSQPFFAVFAPNAPHAIPIPAPRHKTTFGALAPYRPPSWKEATMTDKPAFWRAKKDNWMPSDEVMSDQFRKDQLETLLAVDEAIAAIKASAPADTIFIFTSDNGMSWGEHWQYYQKKSGYDEQIRVPLVISGPGIVHHVEDKIVLNIDLAPTILHYAIATTALAIDGKDISKLLASQSISGWRTDFLAEAIQAVSSEAPAYNAVVEKNWKYIRTVEPGCGIFEEIYNRSDDPYEINSQTNTANGRRQIDLMKTRLLELRDYCQP